MIPHNISLGGGHSQALLKFSGLIDLVSTVANIAVKLLLCLHHNVHMESINSKTHYIHSCERRARSTHTYFTMV